MSQKYIPLHIYLNPERDGAILDWLEDQKNKSAAVREVLWAYLQGSLEAQQVTSQVAIDPAAIYRAIDQALQERWDWGILRQVVEAAVSHALVGLALAPASAPVDEADVLLNELDSHLVVD